MPKFKALSAPNSNFLCAEEIKGRALCHSSVTYSFLRFHPGTRALSKPRGIPVLGYCGTNNARIQRVLHEVRNVLITDSCLEVLSVQVCIWYLLFRVTVLLWNRLATYRRSHRSIHKPMQYSHQNEADDAPPSDSLFMIWVKKQRELRASQEVQFSTTY
jgi:hypothetical protein